MAPGMDVRQRCLVCGRQGTDGAHWPQPVGMGRNRKRLTELPTIPLCRTCHTKMHAGDKDTTAKVVAKVEAYWREVGEWEHVEPLFRAWLSRREYLAWSAK